MAAPQEDGQVQGKGKTERTGAQHIGRACYCERGPTLQPQEQKTKKIQQTNGTPMGQQPAPFVRPAEVTPG